MHMLTLDRKFYEEIVRPAVEEAIPEQVRRIAFGVAGEGSECFGFDDEVSLDHDVSVGVSLWLTEEDAEDIGFRLSTLYDRLPREFGGHPVEHRSRLGGGRHGVCTIGDFYRRTIGLPQGPETWQQWMYAPSYALAQAVNGQVFSDEMGEFSRIRENIAQGMPRDVRLKKMAAKAALMAQSGQYNYSRCLKHGEPGAAVLALAEFVQCSAELAFLLSGKHAPYYKWILRAMGDLPGFEAAAEKLTALLTGQCDRERVIEEVAQIYIEKLRSGGLTAGNWDFLEPHAMQIMERIENPEIRAMHLMEG